MACAQQVASVAIEFYATQPFYQQLAHHGNGSMTTFSAKSRAIVDLFHKLGLQNDGMDEGAPGPQPLYASLDQPVDYEQVYCACARDLDGNEICVFHDGTNA